MPTVEELKWVALFPLMNPTTCDTAYFGGTNSNM